MTINNALADQVRNWIGNRKGFVEKRMFGGLGFMLNGNMCACIWKEFLIARIGAESYAEALTEPGVKEFDVTGRPMKGWVMIDADVLETRSRLDAWLDKATEFVKTLPKK
jgi:TfoX/Sxy family transcriptional regulator of competence genes